MTDVKGPLDWDQGFDFPSQTEIGRNKMYKILGFMYSFIIESGIVRSHFV